MQSNKNLFLVIIAGIVVLGLAYFYANRGGMEPSPEAPAPEAAAPAMDGAGPPPDEYIRADGLQRGADFPGGQ